MQDRLEQFLKGTRRNIREVCEELGIEIPEKLPLEQCSHCNVWTGRLKEDLDGNLICGFCFTNYGE